jgi:hypothetical protein
MASIYAHHMQRHRQSSAQRPAHARKIIGGRLKPMVNVKRLNLAWPALRRSQQQGRGISAAAIGDSPRRWR